MPPDKPEYDAATPLVGAFANHGTMNATILLNHNYNPEDLILTLNGNKVYSHFYNSSSSILMDYTAPNKAGYYEYKIMSKDGKYVTPMHCFCVDIPRFVYAVPFASDWPAISLKKQKITIPELNNLHGFKEVEVVCPVNDNIDFISYVLEDTGTEITITDYGKLIEQKEDFFENANRDFIMKIQNDLPWKIQATNQDGSLTYLYRGLITYVNES